MIRMRITLDRLHCHTETDAGSNSEPYLWTSFFYGDINTATLGPGNRLFTHTPHAFNSSRSFFPNDVEAGDDVPIPSPIGEYTVVMDDGGTEVGAAGFLFALIEEDGTPDDAMRAGHQAFAEATEVAFNAYVDSKFPMVTAPTEEEVEEIKQQIDSETRDAIRDELSWYHILTNHDDFFGFDHDFFSYAELVSILSDSPAEREFSKRIVHERRVPRFLDGRWVTINLVNDYEIFGRISVSEYTPPRPDPCQEELDAYNAALEALNNIDKEIAELQEGLSKVTGPEKVALIAEINYRRETLRPEALEAVAAARAVYEACKNRSGVSVGPLVEKVKLRQSRRQRIAKRLGLSAQRSGCSANELQSGAQSVVRRLSGSRLGLGGFDIGSVGIGPGNDCELLCIIQETLCLDELKDIPREDAELICSLDRTLCERGCRSGGRGTIA